MMMIPACVILVSVQMGRLQAHGRTYLDDEEGDGVLGIIDGGVCALEDPCLVWCTRLPHLVLSLRSETRLEKR